MVTITIFPCLQNARPNHNTTAVVTIILTDIFRIISLKRSYLSVGKSNVEARLIRDENAHEFWLIRHEHNDALTLKICQCKDDVHYLEPREAFNG